MPEINFTEWIDSGMAFLQNAGDSFVWGIQLAAALFVVLGIMFVLRRYM
jgi:hypothetical protein